MKVGELAQQTRASIRSLRYYEEMGLLSCRRGANGYRDFGPEAIAQVEHIRTLLATVFTVADIHLLAPCLDQRTPGIPLCPAALARYREKLAALDAHIRTVHEMRARLVAHIAAEDTTHDHR